MVCRPSWLPRAPCSNGSSTRRVEACGAGLNRHACGKFHRARLKTSWGARHQRASALVDGDHILAAAERYDLSGVLDGRSVRVCAVGSLWTGPSQPDGMHARALIDALVADAERDGAEMALLFPSAIIDDDCRSAFHAMAMIDLTLSVTASSRHGAPMTMVRGGEERDLAAIVAMGRVRADHVRFHLDRDNDFIQYIITTRAIAGRARIGPRSPAAFLHRRRGHHGRRLRDSQRRRRELDPRGMRRPRCLRRTRRRAAPSVNRARAGGAAPDDPCLAASGFSASAGRRGSHDAFDRNASGCVCSAHARPRRRCAPTTCCSGTTICCDAVQVRCGVLDVVIP